MKFIKIELFKHLKQQTIWFDKYRVTGCRKTKVRVHKLPTQSRREKLLCKLDLKRLHSKQTRHCLKDILLRIVTVNRQDKPNEAPPIFENIVLVFQLEIVMNYFNIYKQF